jgi:hypothetical protein
MGILSLRVTLTDRLGGQELEKMGVIMGRRLTRNKAMQLLVR